MNGCADGPHKPAKLSMSRRRLLSSAPLAIAALSASGVFAKTLATSRQLEHGNPLAEVGYGDVQLAAGPHQQQLEQTHEILMGLDEDGLFRPFRMAAGQPAPGRDLGGWHSSPKTFGPESFGYWMSALSRYYAATGDVATRAKLQRWLELFDASLDPKGSIIAEFRNTSCCIYNKLLCGLEDAYHYGELKPALGTLEKLTSAALPYMPGRALEQTEPNNGGESYIIPEYQLVAWQWGGEDRHLEIATNYLFGSFFEPLARGENVLPGLHLYSHINALCSAAKAYLVFGNDTHLRAAVNGFRFIEQQSYATGAAGAEESFLPLTLSPKQIEDARKVDPTFDPSFQTLGDAILKLKTHFETGCGSHALFKLTRYLLRITKDPHYGDYMERVMYNCSLGALPLNKFGKAFYQSNYSKYATKQYFDGYGHVMEDEWPCCSGTLPQLAADYRVSAYFRDERGVFVNLYVPSTLKWKQGRADISLSQITDYPLKPTIDFSLTASRPTTFTLRFRIPAWAQGASISVNEQPLASDVRPGSFAEVRRVWKTGDRIALTLPMANELVAADDDHPNLVALRHGPMVLFAIGFDLPKMTQDRLLAAKQISPGSSEWKSGEIRLLPWWIIKDEVYTTYHEVA